MGAQYSAEVPAFGPWVIKEVAETHYLMVRNPYFHAVDEGGESVFLTSTKC